MSMHRKTSSSPSGLGRLHCSGGQVPSNTLNKHCGRWHAVWALMGRLSTRLELPNFRLTIVQMHICSLVLQVGAGLAGSAAACTAAAGGSAHPGQCPGLAAACPVCLALHSFLLSLSHLQQHASHNMQSQWLKCLFLTRQKLPVTSEATPLLA